ncbi:hypothetical protein [Paenibacillus sp. GXUN7292]|uniref:hypothetical protein n=1 Tax=Paenibacillus sp. GXUN7292 TaxID=3422499 RepID=UPI003D7D7491
MKKKVNLLLCLSLLMSLFVFASSAAAGSSQTPRPSSGINVNSTNINTGSGDVKEVTDVMDKWITNIRVVGVLVAVLGLVIGGIFFSISLGNSQRRGIAIAAMLCAAGGIVVVAKAPVVAGYLLNS